MNARVNGPDSLPYSISILSLELEISNVVDCFSHFDDVDADLINIVHVTVSALLEVDVAFLSLVLVGESVDTIGELSKFTIISCASPLPFKHG